MNKVPARRTEARVRYSAWPGWIWAVPLAALAVSGWLGIRALIHHGETVTVRFDNAYGMKADNTDVTLRGVKIGTVTAVKLAPDGQHVEAMLEIDREEKRYLRRDTKFFLLGAKPALNDPASLKALVSGPQIVMEPGPGKPADHFDGEDRRPALAPGHGPEAFYSIQFEGAAGQLKDGATVELRGFNVGTVTSVRLAYDARTGELTTPVQIALDPVRLGIENVRAPVDGNWQPVVDAMITHLVARGLRARLAQDPPLVGADEVTLDFVPGASGAQPALRGGMLVIPSVASADIDSMMAKANQIITKVNALPIAQIGADVTRIAAHIAALVSSPQIRDSIHHVDSAVTQVDRTLQQVSPQIGPLVTQLRQTADAADSVVNAANHTLGADGTSQNDLSSTLRELSDTARSIRALADFLQRHPEALLRGKPRGEQ